MNTVSPSATTVAQVMARLVNQWRRERMGRNVTAICNGDLPIALTGSGGRQAEWRLNQDDVPLDSSRQEFITNDLQHPLPCQHRRARGRSASARQFGSRPEQCDPDHEIASPQHHQRDEGRCDLDAAVSAARQGRGHDGKGGVEHRSTQDVTGREGISDGGDPHQPERARAES